MTLIKSMLLGSATAIVAVAAAQAADLPTRKAAPVEYVRVCNVGGITGWVLPGSDTCVKLSGYITAQFTGGNLNTQYNWGSVVDALAAATNPAAPITYTIPPALLTTGSAAAWSQRNQRVLLARPDTFLRDATGWTNSSQFRLRLCLQHRLRAPDRSLRHQLGKRQRVRHHRRLHLYEHRLPDLGRHHRR